MNKPGSKSTEQYRGEIEVVVSFNVKSLSSSQLTLNNQAFKSTSVTGASAAAAAAAGSGGSLKALTAVRGIGKSISSQWNVYTVPWASRDQGLLCVRYTVINGCVCTLL